VQVAYPPAGSGPHTVNGIVCGDGYHATCVVRMQFFDGLGEPGNLSAAADNESA